MKRHEFDPFSFVLGLFFGGLGLYFVFGNRTAAEIGPGWIWPFPVLLVGLVAVLYAARSLRRAGARHGHGGAAEVRPEPTPDEGQPPQHGPGHPV